MTRLEYQTAAIPDDWNAGRLESRKHLSAPPAEITSSWPKTADADSLSKPDRKFRGAQYSGFGNF